MRKALRTTLEMDRPALVHVKTVKGRGYPPAEADGEAMHGATPFVIESGKAAGKKKAGPPNYTDVFGHALVAEAERDPRVVGITAAMLKGTGMQHMMAAFPERTYDVGIAEQHAVVFACGLAINGFRPVCAIYSTFLQRAFDPIVHDAAIQDLPVVFAIDRGGLVGDDGPTHHGCFDLAYLRSIPGMTIMAPMDEAELVHMLHTALRIDGPVAFRYPRGAGTGIALPERPAPVEIGRGVVLEAGEDVALVGYGFGATLATQAADLVAEGTGARPTVVNARFCKPIDGALIRQLADRHELIVTIEDHSEMAGFGSAVLEVLEDTPARVLRLGLPDRFIEHGKRELLLNDVGLTPERVAARTVRALREPSRRSRLIAEQRASGHARGPAVPREPATHRVRRAAATTLRSRGHARHDSIRPSWPPGSSSRAGPARPGGRHGRARAGRRAGGGQARHRRGGGRRTRRPPRRRLRLAGRAQAGGRARRPGRRRRRRRRPRPRGVHRRVHRLPAAPRGGARDRPGRGLRPARLGAAPGPARHGHGAHQRAPPRTRRPPVGAGLRDV